MANPLESLSAAANIAQAELGLGNVVMRWPSSNLAGLASVAADLAGNPLGLIATNGLAFQVTLAKMQLDAKDGKEIEISENQRQSVVKFLIFSLAEFRFLADTAPAARLAAGR